MERAPFKHTTLSPIPPTHDPCDTWQYPCSHSALALIIIYAAGRNTLTLLNVADLPKPVFRLPGVDGGEHKGEPMTTSSGEFYDPRDKPESDQAGNVRELFRTPVLSRVTLCM